jgi:hypothetical protein
MTDFTDQLYEIATEWLTKSNTDGITAASLIPLATHLMTAVQKMAAPGNGAKKKTAVIHVVNRLIEDTIKEKEDKIILLRTTNIILPPAIDAIIALATSGALRKWWKRLLARCCCC